MVVLSRGRFDAAISRKDQALSVVACYRGDGLRKVFKATANLMGKM
jgi:hypothetical protein